MTTTPPVDAAQASTVGGRTLEVFADTPRLNRWLYSKLAGYVRGDVLEVGSGIGNLSRLIVAAAASDARVVLSDVEPHYLDALSRTFAGDPRVVVAHDPGEAHRRPSGGVGDASLMRGDVERVGGQRRDDIHERPSVVERPDRLASGRGSTGTGEPATPWVPGPMTAKPCAWASPRSIADAA